MKTYEEKIRTVVMAVFESKLKIALEFAQKAASKCAGGGWAGQGKRVEWDGATEM